MQKVHAIKNCLGSYVKCCKHFSTWPATGVTRSGLANLNVDVTDKAFGSIQRCSNEAVFSLARWCKCLPWILVYMKLPVPKALKNCGTFFHLDVPLEILARCSSILEPEVSLS